MCPDAIWQAFRETGDPLYYLLYKSVNKGEAPQSKESAPQTAPGNLPRSGD